MVGGTTLARLWNLCWTSFVFIGLHHSSTGFQFLNFLLSLHLCSCCYVSVIGGEEISVSTSMFKSKSPNSLEEWIVERVHGWGRKYPTWVLLPQLAQTVGEQKGDALAPLTRIGLDNTYIQCRQAGPIDNVIVWAPQSPRICIQV